MDVRWRLLAHLTEVAPPAHHRRGRLAGRVHAPGLLSHRRLVYPRASCSRTDQTRGNASVEDLIACGHSLGADRVWLYAQVVDAGFGFVRRGSYVRLEATRPPEPVDLALPPVERIQEIQRACFGDLWGRRDPGPPNPDSVYVGLHEGGEWVGICEVDAEA